MAAYDLLLEVQCLRDVSLFDDFLSLSVLCDRLVTERDKPVMVSKIVSLLLPSFFPVETERQTETETEKKSSVTKEHIKRALDLSTRSLSAAEVFYAHLIQTERVSVGVLTKFVCLLVDVLKNQTKKWTERETEREDEETEREKENVIVNERKQIK